ncbi:MAG TPA: hypothetical protein VKO67_00105, partial [Smithellaceae bacterium]|nr:hypothetical protein [Smithellaceae bacterium]
MEQTISAKITRPGLTGVVQRKRLFSIFSRLTEKPVVWVSSPAGSGKTKLVSSFLDSRKFPCIWYSCDEGDSDLATFFYYMGLAAKKALPRYKKPLPMLTPDYPDRISTFARMFFEQLYGRLTARPGTRRAPCRFFIVLDNYQDIPADSPFQDMIANGFDRIPEGVRLVVISRTDPPPAFARLQANDKISLLEYGDVRFTYEESVELLHGRMPALDKKFLKTTYEKTKGWAAGIILMLEWARLKGSETQLGEAADVAYGRIFDYFAGEIFDKASQEIKDFLHKTAFLPILSVSMAETLTGISHAGQILAALNRYNYFTERLSGSGQRYQYHPLFRDFLINRVRTQLSPDELALLQTKTAAHLEQSGQIEDAARLYCEAGEGEALARMVTRHARELLGQGRNRTVSEWIAGIQKSITDHHPWLLYWSGMCSFP